MLYKIIWQPRAISSYVRNIKYLKDNWSEKEIENFEESCTKKLINLSRHPRIGTSRNKKYPNVRFTLVHKHVALIYRIKSPKKEIELLVFWNTSQNPVKLKYL